MIFLTVLLTSSEDFVTQTMTGSHIAAGQEQSSVDRMFSLALMSHPDINPLFVSATRNLAAAFAGAHADHVQRYAASAGLTIEEAKAELTAVVPSLRAARAAAEQSWSALMKECGGDVTVAAQQAQDKPWLHDYAARAYCTTEHTVMALSQQTWPACAA